MPEAESVNEVRTGELNKVRSCGSEMKAYGLLPSITQLLYGDAHQQLAS